MKSAGQVFGVCLDVGQIFPGGQPHDNETTSILAAAALSFGAATLHAQGNCAFSGGNLCLVQCGVFTNTCYDQADLEEDGYWLASAIYPDCTATCSAHAIGVNYCDPPYGCGNGIEISHVKVQILHQAAPGAPLFAPSCSGGRGLLQADVPQQRGSASFSPSDRRDRQLLIRQFVKEN